jgi:alpha-tubulin suppressor-like RCC1 family protein
MCPRRAALRMLLIWILTLGVSTRAVAQTPVSTKVAAGHEHTLLVKPDGTVWAFGANSSGQLGDNTFTIRRVPQPVAGLGNVIAVAAGTAHSLALTSGGTVFAWGGNSFGAVGDGTTTVKKTPVALSLTSVVAIAAGDHHSLALRSNGDVYAWAGTPPDRSVMARPRT